MVFNINNGDNNNNNDNSDNNNNNNNLMNEINSESKLYNYKNYYIDDVNNLNFNIEENTNIFLVKYFIIINEYSNMYLDNIHNNINITNDKTLRYYIFIRGIEILYPIITLLLMYSNNIELVNFYCYRAYNYYIEFISQLDINNNQLELNIKDGIVFVYKKTIFEIKDSLNNINKSNINNDNIIKTENISIIVKLINELVKIFVVKDIINLVLNKENNFICINKNIFKLLNKVSKLYKNEYSFNKLINIIYDLLNNITSIINKINIVNNTVFNNNIDNIINFNNLFTLIEKIIIKVSILIEEKKIVNIPILSQNDIENLNSNRIKDIIESI